MYLVVNHVIIKNLSQILNLQNIFYSNKTKSRLKHFFSSSAFVRIFITESGYQASKSNGKCWYVKALILHLDTAQHFSGKFLKGCSPMSVNN